MISASYPWRVLLIILIIIIIIVKSLEYYYIYVRTVGMYILILNLTAIHMLHAMYTWKISMVDVRICKRITMHVTLMC